MTSRSNRAEVRNPVLALPSARLLSAMPLELRRLLFLLLLDLSREAQARAQASWTKRKAFLAAYWATVAVYARHIARTLLAPAERCSAKLPLHIVQKGHPALWASNWAEASRLHCERRDKLGLGSSAFPEAIIHVFDMPVARISFNGRIWALGEWEPTARPIYDNQSAANACDAERSAILAQPTAIEQGGAAWQRHSP
ncbi:hypothetical protein ACFOKF_22150 [Sphingobium rhizovicinum]|uniref:Uncharacterized protein n=1 Tax=Sphingobium rhizovicinum TaxID=432308 RepID=A0ABV7NN50_9SPHN